MASEDPVVQGLPDFEPHAGGGNGHGHGAEHVLIAPTAGADSIIPGMGGGDKVEIEDPQELVKAAAGADSLASELKDRGDHGASLLTMATWGFLGEDWGGKFAGALGDTCERWEEQVKALAKVCRDLGDSCRQTAGNYCTTESENEEIMKSLSDFD